MADRILLPVDGSDASDRARDYAVFLAAASDATVHAVYVLDSGELPAGFAGEAGQFEADLRETARETLDAAEAACEAAGVPVTRAVAVGHPADELLAAADGVDLVVMGAHARGRLARFLRGSVADEVARRAAVPVLRVPEAASGPPALDRVVLATDGSESARRAREFAFDLAAAHGATVHALYVVEGRVGRSGALRALLEDRGEAVLREARAAGARRDVQVDATTRSGRPDEEVLDFAGDRDADLVVLGTHGRTGLDRLVMGSVAAGVVREATLPVLTVPATTDG